MHIFVVYFLRRANLLWSYRVFTPLTAALEIPQGAKALLFFGGRCFATLKIYARKKRKTHEMKHRVELQWVSERA